MRIKTLCPHCDNHAVARTSVQITPTFKQITYQCTNPLCGFSFIVEHVIARGLSPSAMPKPSVRVPLSPHVLKQLTRQLDSIT